MAVVGIVEGFEGPNVRGWASSSEATCRVSVADAAGNVIASGSATKRQYSGEPPPFRYRFEIPTGMSKASLVRVFADGHELAGSPLTLGQALFDGTLQIAHGKIS